MDINIDIILADLKDDKVPRTQKNLDKLNDILKAYAGSGQRDFSIAQMGRVSAAEGGPGYEALRATKNKHYRTLLKHGQQSAKQPPKSRYRQPHALSLFHRITSYLSVFQTLRYGLCLVRLLPSATVIAKRLIC